MIIAGMKLEVKGSKVENLPSMGEALGSIPSLTKAKLEMAELLPGSSGENDGFKSV